MKPNSGFSLRIAAAIALIGGCVALAQNDAAAGPPNPALTSDYVRETVTPPGDELDLDVCESWNPEFVGNGMRCCTPSRGYTRAARRRARCDAHRNRANYCSEMTEDQKEYVEAVQSGKVADLMAFLGSQVQHRSAQAFCNVNNGFLVRGRPIVPTKDNIIQIRSPQRCTNYGTEPMAAMLEYLGRQIKKEFAPEYPGIHFLIGDVAAPRGGCLASMGGRRGHKSHSTGQDADIGFVTPIKNHPSPDTLHKNFQPKPNYWFIKQLFHNPYACIKVVFLDHRDIAKLAKAAGGDEEWPAFRKFIRHVRGHNNHFHVRIGDGPGPAGCVPNANPDEELKTEYESDGESGKESAPDSGAGEDSQVD